MFFYLNFLAHVTFQKWQPGKMKNSECLKDNYNSFNRCLNWLQGGPHIGHNIIMTSLLLNSGVFAEVSSYHAYFFRLQVSRGNVKECPHDVIKKKGVKSNLSLRNYIFFSLRRQSQIRPTVQTRPQGAQPVQLCLPRRRGWGPGVITRVWSSPPLMDFLSRPK